MKIPLITGLSLMGLLMLGNASHAQTPEDNWNRCHQLSNDDSDGTLAACNAFISSGQGDAASRSNAFESRSLLLESKGRCSDAIADNKMALQLDPTNGAARIGPGCGGG